MDHGFKLHPDAESDVPDINDGDMINCTDCIKHGGDWECDRVHCRKGTKQQATKASNCISRQAAIDALYAFWSGSSFDGEGYDIADKSEDVLSELPSAQPELCEDAVSRQSLLSDLKELIAAWKKYPVMAEQIKGVETAIGYVKVIPSVKPDSKELSSTHKALDTISRQSAIVQLSHNKTGDDDCDVVIQNDIETIKALPSVEPEQPSEIQDILDYLDTALHPIISPEHWNVYSELHDMISTLPSAEPEIVTCKECKRRGEEPIADGRYWCEVHNTFMYYCSDAERRTDE